MTTAAETARERSRGVTPRGVVMRPEDEAHLAALRRADRSFPHVLSAPGVDWSASASRRAGWRRPARPALGANVAGATAALRAAALLPPDTLRVAILRIDFRADRGGDASSGDGHFDLSADTTSPPIDRPPRNRTYFQSHAEALSRYYDAQTYGRVVVQADVWPRAEDGAYSVSDMADFGPWSFGQGIFRAAVHMFRTMMFAADSQSIALGDRIPWDHYDRFVIIHAGSDLQSDVRQDSKEDIPSFTLGVEDTDVVIFPDSTTRPIDRVSFIPETINQDGYFGAINGVLAHECGHNFFGFFDVYDIETGLPVVGFWSLMDSGNQVGALVTLKDGSQIFAIGLLPPSIDPFHRAWATDALTLPPMPWGETALFRSSERHPDVRRVDLTGDEYLLIENRHLSPADSVHLDQDSTTHVILGPKSPDRFEYDALLPGGGLLVWHVDASVIPLESTFPLDTALRVNPDFGLNSNPDRLGLSVVEADGLGDLGDLSSPYIEGSPFDPFFPGNNTVLADSTAPSLIPHIRTRTHMRIDVEGDADSTLRFGPDSTMRARASRTWAMANFPVRAPFPPGGAALLAVDADGDGKDEVCWAGGTLQGGDSSGVFVMRGSGGGLGGADPQIVSLDRRPDPILAALPDAGAQVPGNPRRGALFAVVTRAAFPGDTLAGRLWLLDHTGNPLPGWPVRVGAGSTPPVIAGRFPDAAVFVGESDGRVHAFGLDGREAFISQKLVYAMAGRLAVRVDSVGSSTPGQAYLSGRVAAGDAGGTILVQSFCVGCSPLVDSAPDFWTARVGEVGKALFAPDFLWIPFGGGGPNAAPPCARSPYTLVVRDVDRLTAFCDDGSPLAGWGRALPDTLVTALGAGDPDGSGFPEVLVQTLRGGVAFVGASGAPSPGWPRRAADEDLVTNCPALSADVDGDGRSEVVALDGSGIIAAWRALDGKQPPGWPLASGAGARGAPVLADLDGDGFLELVAPDNVDRLWGYTLPVRAGGPVAPWAMLGGDPGRTCALPLARAPLALAPAPGPLVPGSLLVYPNPARRKPVTFAYTLTEPATVTFRILDTSGHQVASFTREGRQSTNSVVWEPGSLPGGLYLAQVRFVAGGREHHEIVQVGLLR